MCQDVAKGDTSRHILYYVLYLKGSTISNKFHLSKIFSNNQQIVWGEGVINKYRLKTPVNILELQCFYITINLICSFHQIICQKQRLILLHASQMFKSNDSEHKHNPS